MCMHVGPAEDSMFMFVFMLMSKRARHVTNIIAHDSTRTHTHTRAIGIT